MKIWQRLCGRWTQLVFRERSEEVTPKIKCLRLLEEVLELSQAECITAAEAEIILWQVYARPWSTPQAELGGVAITLAGYAETAGYDLEEAFWTEFERIMDPQLMEKVRRRNLEGDKIGFVKKVVAYAEPTGQSCSICGEPIFETHSGSCCSNGHGGAPRLSDICARGERCVCKDPSPRTCNAFMDANAVPTRR